MWNYRIYVFCRYAKYIGLTSLIVSIFSDAAIFRWLGLFLLLLFVQMALNFSVIKDCILQCIGIVKVEQRYGKNTPSIENYHSEIQYDLPFEGEWTVVNGGFTKEFSHSWDIPTQRYAYDFVMLDESGSSYSGDLKKNESYYCYAKAILAPADGVVVKVVNNAEDTLIIGNGRFFSRAGNIEGNYIIIRHNDNEYSTLAHLKKDSILVKVGEKVSRGQRIAACGNTGNSSEPHLHFQIQDGPDPYKSAGLPIRFSGIRIRSLPNYGRMDPRPRMDMDSIPEGLITRGYAVANN